MKPILYKKTKWLRFFIVEQKPKTFVIDVRNTSNEFLGSIRWHGPWRQYTFNIDNGPALIFNNECLQDIANVLTCLNDEHKEGKRFHEGTTA